MDRGYRLKHVRPDRRRDRTALGLLVAAWIAIALAGTVHWLTRTPAFVVNRPIGTVLHEPPLPWPDTPPRGAAWRGDRFPLATIAEAPRRRGTYAELERAGLSVAGPQSILEITTSPAIFIGGVGGALRVLPVEYPPVIMGTFDESSVDPVTTETGKLVLADGCLRLDSRGGPLVVLDHRIAGAYRDDEGWLTIGPIGNGNNALRAGETGEIGTAPALSSPVLASLRTRCGGGDVVTVHFMRRRPTCDLTRAEEIAQWRAQRAEFARARAEAEARTAELLAACRGQGKAPAYCERTVRVPPPPAPPPPPPPPPIAAPAPITPPPPGWVADEPPPPRTDCDYPDAGET